MPWRRSDAREIARAAVRLGVLASALIGEKVGREAVQGVRALEAARHTLHVIGAPPVGLALHVAGEDCDVAQRGLVQMGPRPWVADAPRDMRPLGSARGYLLYH